MKRKWKEIWKEVNKDLDWKKIRRVMKLIDHTWTDKNKVPSKKQIKKHVRKMVKQLVTEYPKIILLSSGGFTVDVVEYEENDELVEFITVSYRISTGEINLYRGGANA